METLRRESPIWKGWSMIKISWHGWMQKKSEKPSENRFGGKQIPKKMQEGCNTNNSLKQLNDPVQKGNPKCHQKTSSSAQNVAFVSQSKSSTNKVKSGFTGAYSTCTPSTSSTNIPEKEVLCCVFADEVYYSSLPKQSEGLRTCFHEELEQIE
ncbi:hypothetical protein Tco_0183337 [Tanacetum coccineum]